METGSAPDIIVVMRKRPPFTLVLSALVAAAALAIALAGRGSGHQPTTSQPPTVGIGPASACITTGALARVADRSAIVISATAHAPVRVTEQAVGPRGIATVTRSEMVSASVKARAPVEVQRTSGARARVCAKGQSPTAARARAVRAAYARALTAAHSLAVRQAGQSLNALIHSQYPRVLAAAKNRAAAKAHQLAVAAGTALAARARAQARQRAGD